jgi:transcriptional regulator with XRE-family HTH domain
MTAPLNLVGAQVRKFRNRNNWTQETLAARLQVAGWDVSRESLAKLEAQFRRVPDCELLFLAKVLKVNVMDLFPARLDLKRLDPALRLKVSTKHPHRKRRRRRAAKTIPHRVGESRRRTARPR